ncbi:MAG: DUF169 domain-containing protein [Chloroflexia bacterium]
MDWNEVNVVLERHIRPATFPLALRMLPAGEEVPEKARRPWRDLGVRMATCQVWNMARRYGWTLAAGLEDLSCPPGKVVLGLAPALPYYLEGNLCAGMYTAGAEAGARTEAATPRLEYGRYSTLVVAPLSRATFEPEVILLYGNPAQVLRLVIAALYRQGGRLEASFSGRLDCADILVGTPRRGTPQVILPCYGDRIFGQTQDEELAFALPPAALPDLLDGLEGTHRGGIRYPIPSFLRYTGQYPATYERLEELWTQG